MKYLIALSVLLSACASQSRVPSAAHTIFEDSRDGTKYGVRKIGSLEWLEADAKIKVAGSRCYNDSEELCAQLGRLYTLEQAQKACAAGNGWRLATDADWKNLETEMGISKRDLEQDRYMGKRGSDEGGKLKADPSFGMGEFTGFYFNDGSHGSFAGRDESEKDPSSFDRTYFWAPGSDKVYRRNIRKNTNMIHRFSNPAEGYWNAARCVRNGG